MRLHVILVSVLGCSSSSSSGTQPPAPDASGLADAATTTDASAVLVSDAAHVASCCTSAYVPGGTYARKYATADGGATAEAAPATVSSFRLDAYEVTVARFREFVTAWKGGYELAAGAGKHAHLNGGQGLTNVQGGYETGWDPSNGANVAPTNDNLACEANLATWTPAAGDHEDLPINCVDWWEAYAFCTWDGGFLPSEAEWEYAAAGGDEQREYPWGATDPGTQNAYAIYGCNYPLDSGNCLGGAAPVGTAAQGLGRWGQLDLAGNVNEWTVDSFGDYVTPCTDCANLDATSSRVVRGGYFDDDLAYLVPASRSDDAPASRSACIGFRCARAP